MVKEGAILNKFLFLGILFSLFLYTNVLADGTGGTITHDGLYTVHTFLSNGTFVPPVSISKVEVLLVGGGGGGGEFAGGGGQGGGIVYENSHAIPGGSYSVVVGAGGLGEPGSSTQVRGQSGSSSTFDNLKATGGAGGVAASFSGNDGANGLQYSINGTPTYYGGSGGYARTYGTALGGLGGGGNGNYDGFVLAGNGTNGLGGGGGADWISEPAGNGGSGVVIIKYLTPSISFTEDTTLGILSQNWIFANFTFADESTVASFYINLYNSSGIVNSTTTERGINFTNLQGTYYLNITITNTSGTNFSTATRTIYLDNIFPFTNLISPINYFNSSSTNINLTANLSDSGGLKNATLNVYYSNGSLMNSISTSYLDGTGGTITTDGLYTVHKFTTNGTFVPPVGV
ncbi:MAG: glycine-rich domain-containing protein, partial [archaeon]